MIINCYTFSKSLVENKLSHAEYNSLLSILRQIRINGLFLEDEEFTRRDIMSLCEKYDGDDPVPDRIEMALQELIDGHRVFATTIRERPHDPCASENRDIGCANRRSPTGRFTICPSTPSYRECTFCRNIPLLLTKEEFESNYAPNAKVDRWNCGRRGNTRPTEVAAGSIDGRDSFREMIWEPFFKVTAPEYLTIYDRNIGRLQEDKISPNFKNGLIYLLEVMRDCGAGTLPITIKTTTGYWRDIEDKNIYRNNIVTGIQQICREIHSGPVKLLLPRLDNRSLEMVRMVHERYFHSNVITLQSDNGLDLLIGTRELKRNQLLLRPGIQEETLLYDGGWEEFKVCN